MDKAAEQALPPYENEDPLSQEKAPAYEVSASASAKAGKPHALLSTSGTTLTLDPTGTSIIEPAPSNAPPHYTLTKSLLHVNVGTSIHIKRPDSNGREIEVYAIGDEYISPLKMVRKQFRDVTAARSHGLAVGVGLRKIAWSFGTRVAIPNSDNVDSPAGTRSFGIYLIGLGTGPETIQHVLLQLSDGKWVDEDDEVVAIVSEGGAESEGMPVLSVLRDLDQELMDFLVSAWCVTMWGKVGKKSHHLSHSSDSKLHIGKHSPGHHDPDVIR